MGSNAIQVLPRLQAVQNEAMKRALPKIPFIPVNENPSGVAAYSRPFDAQLWKNDKAPAFEAQFFPLAFSRVDEDTSFYTLPWEPLISISGSNEIVKRKVARATNFIGTVKERWSQNDYDITITGSIFGEDMIGDQSQAFPRREFELLKEYMTHPKGLIVQCEPLQLLGINRIVVESFSFPFTKGENVQAYEIQAVSDFTIDLLLPIE
jgi:hypothetical protein